MNEHIKAIKDEVEFQREFFMSSISLTNGCFDLYHAGHGQFLQQAGLQYDEDEDNRLFVGVDSDTRVKELKGHTRPIYPENERLELVANHFCVTSAFLFNDKDEWLEIIGVIKPDYYFKASDYNINTICPIEKDALFAANPAVQIKFLPIEYQRSTSKTIAQIKKNEHTLRYR